MVLDILSQICVRYCKWCQSSLLYQVD